MEIMVKTEMGAINISDEDLAEHCNICGEEARHLNKHILEAHGEKAECQLCQLSLPKANLRWHILKEHCQKSGSKCTLCGERFATNSALKSHNQHLHLKRPQTIKNETYFKCSNCNEKFERKKMLDAHMQSDHVGETVTCSDCKTEVDFDKVSEHTKELHRRMKRCPHCNKDLTHYNISRHIKQVHDNENIKCPECGKVFALSSWQHHTHSVLKKAMKRCDICNKEISCLKISFHIRKVHGIGKRLENKIKKINKDIAGGREDGGFRDDRMVDVDLEDVKLGY